MCIILYLLNLVISVGAILDVYSSNEIDVRLQRNQKVRRKTAIKSKNTGNIYTPKTTINMETKFTLIKGSNSMKAFARAKKNIAL